MTPTSEVLAHFPSAYRELFEPARLKVFYSGRGAAKSWSFAGALLTVGGQACKRIICARETMKSIKESVHKLLDDQIRSNPAWRDFYTIQQQDITGKNGTEFLFVGLKHNIDNIKSLEGADIVWVEEAQNVSKDSWDKLLPTVRKAGSEIWVSYNPELADDETHKRFVTLLAELESAMAQFGFRVIVKKVSWRDNPWFGPELQAEMAATRAKSEDDYDHIWEGNPKRQLEGAIYAAELRAAEGELRITTVPYDRSRPVDCYWDLGYGDMTAIWCVQAFPFHYQVIDYIENNAQTIHWYIAELQRRGYVYRNHWLPWDLGAQAKNMGQGKSIEGEMRAKGLTVQISPKLAVVDQINAARTIFPLCHFDQQRCADGLMALRHYRWATKEVDGRPDGKTQQNLREPLHDWASHGASAFQYFALGAKAPEIQREQARAQEQDYSQWG